ncbi:unnamed protein product, partial [Laminaria digitata]
MSGGFNYPHDADGLLDGLVLSVRWFDDGNNRGKLHVCKECHRSLSIRKIPEAALANGFWVSHMPSKFDGATVIEPAAAYAVRVKGHVIALKSKKIRNVPGSAQRSLRGTSVFYASDSCSVAQELPLAATGLMDMISTVLAGKGKPTESQLKRLLGARKHMVRDLIDYMQDKDANLVNDFSLARKATMSEANLDAYPCDGGVPPEILKACLNPRDPNNLRRRAASLYTNDRRENEAIDDDDDDSDDDDSEGCV